MTDIDFLADFAYRTGTDPIEYATTNVIQAHIDAHLHRLGVAPDPGTGALSCRILADLLGAGWTPPEVPK